MPSKAPPVSLDEQIAELNRELKMRLDVYPKLIRFGKLHKDEANKRHRALTAARNSLLDYQRLRDGAQTSLPLNHPIQQ